MPLETEVSPQASNLRAGGVSTAIKTRSNIADPAPDPETAATALMLLLVGVATW